MSPVHKSRIPEHSYCSSQGWGYSLSQHFLTLFWFLGISSSSFVSLSLSFSASSKCFHKLWIHLLVCTFFLIWPYSCSSPRPSFTCFILTGIFSPWEHLLGISTQAHLQFLNALRKQGKLGRQALTFKSPWNIYPNWVPIPKMFAFLFLLADGWSEEKKTVCLPIFILQGWLFHGNSFCVYRQSPQGWLPLVAAVAASTAPPPQDSPPLSFLHTSLHSLPRPQLPGNKRKPKCYIDIFINRRAHLL